MVNMPCRRTPADAGGFRGLHTDPDRYRERACDALRCLWDAESPGQPAMGGPVRVLARASRVRVVRVLSRADRRGGEHKPCGSALLVDRLSREPRWRGR